MTIDLAIFFAAITIWILGNYWEYRNPLWSQIVDAGEEPIEKLPDKNFHQMIFFWNEKGGRKAADSYNDMNVYLSNDGIFITQPIFFMPRKPVLLRWSQLERGPSFHKWIAKRTELSIKGTDLRLSVTSSTTKSPAWKL